MTTFYHEAVRAGDTDLGDAAAHHARVKRLEVGDAVTVTDGRGRCGTGVISTMDKRSLVVAIATVSDVAPPTEIHLFVPVADKDRMLWLAEKVTELQVTSWTPVMYERSKSVNPRGEGDGFARKLNTRMIAALEQSGGAWIPTVSPIVTVDDMAQHKGIVLERSGKAIGPWATAAPINLAVGPEGGFTREELGTLVDAGWVAASFGDVTLRFETAAISAVAIARALT